MPQYEQYDYTNPLMWLDYPGGLLRGMIAGKEFGETARGAELTGGPEGRRDELMTEMLMDPLGPAMAGIGGLLGLMRFAPKASTLSRAGRQGSKLSGLAEDFASWSSVDKDLFLEHLMREGGSTSDFVPVGQLYDDALSLDPWEAGLAGVPVSRRETGQFGGLSQGRIEETQELLAGLSEPEQRTIFEEMLRTQEIESSVQGSKRQQLVAHHIEQGTSAHEAEALADNAMAEYYGGGGEFAFPSLGQLGEMEQDRLLKMQTAIAEEVGRTVPGRLGREQPRTRYVSPDDTGQFGTNTLTQEGFYSARRMGQEATLIGKLASDAEETTLIREMYQSRFKMVTERDQTRMAGGPVVKTGTWGASNEKNARLWASVYDSDVTVWFGREDTLDAQLAAEFAYVEGKIFIANPTPEFWAGWMHRNQPTVVNITGTAKGASGQGAARQTSGGKASLKAIQDGNKTAVSRHYALGAKGDVISFDNDPTQYVITQAEMVTEPLKLDPSNPWGKIKDKLSVMGKRENENVGNWITHFKKVSGQADTTPALYGQQGGSALAPFAPISLEFKGQQFDNAEAAYQAFKQKDVKEVANEGLMAEVLEAKYNQSKDFRKALEEAGHITHEHQRISKYWSEALPRLLNDLRKNKGIPVPERPIPAFHTNIDEVIEAGIQGQMGVGLSAGADLPPGVAARQVNPLIPGTQLQATTGSGTLLTGWDVGERRATTDIIGESVGGFGLGEWRMIRHPKGGYRLTQLPRGFKHEPVAKKAAEEIITEQDILRGRETAFTKAHDAGDIDRMAKEDFYAGSPNLRPSRDLPSPDIDFNLGEVPEKIRNLERDIQKQVGPDALGQRIAALHQELDEGLIGDDSFNELLETILNESGETNPVLRSAFNKAQAEGHPTRYVENRGKIYPKSFTTDAGPFRETQLKTRSWVNDDVLMAKMTKEEQAALAAFEKRLNAKQELFHWGEGSEMLRPQNISGQAIQLVDNASLEELLDLERRLTTGKKTKLTKISAASENPEMQAWLKVRHGFLDHVGRAIEAQGGRRAVIPDELIGASYKIEQTGGSGIQLLGHIQRIKGKAQRFGSAYPAKLNETESRILASYMGVDPNAILDAALETAPRAESVVSQWGSAPNWARMMPGAPAKHVKYTISPEGNFQSAIRKMAAAAKTRPVTQAETALGSLSKRALGENIQFLDGGQLEQLEELAVRMVEQDLPAAAESLSKIRNQIENLGEGGKAQYGADGIGEMAFSVITPEAGGRTMVVQSLLPETGLPLRGLPNRLPMAQTTDELFAHMALREAALAEADNILFLDNAGLNATSPEGVVGIIKKITGASEVNVRSVDVPSVPKQVNVGERIDDISPLLGMAAAVRATGSTAEKMRLLLQKLASSPADGRSSKLFQDLLLRSKRTGSKLTEEGLQKLFLIGNEQERVMQSLMSMEGTLSTRALVDEPALAARARDLPGSGAGGTPNLPGPAELAERLEDLELEAGWETRATDYADETRNAALEAWEQDAYDAWLDTKLSDPGATAPASYGSIPGSGAGATPDLPGPAEVAERLEDLELEAKAGKLYHGTRHNSPESFIDENGNLVLKASENFEGKQVGVSFSESQDAALDYATRVPGTGPGVRSRAQGAVFEIDADAIPTESLFTESGEEIATRGTKPVVIPKGKFRIIKDVAAKTELEKWEAKQIERVKGLSDSDLAKHWEENLVHGELAEFGGKYEDPLARVKPGVSQDLVAKYGPVAPDDFPLWDEIIDRVSRSNDPEATIAEMARGIPDPPREPIYFSREEFAEDIRKALPKRTRQSLKKIDPGAPEELLLPGSGAGGTPDLPGPAEFAERLEQLEQHAVHRKRIFDELLQKTGGSGVGATPDLPGPAEVAELNEAVDLYFRKRGLNPETGIPVEARKRGASPIFRKERGTAISKPTPAQMQLDELAGLQFLEEGEQPLILGALEAAEPGLPPELMAAVQSGWKPEYEVLAKSLKGHPFVKAELRAAKVSANTPEAIFDAVEEIHKKIQKKIGLSGEEVEEWEKFYNRRLDNFLKNQTAELDNLIGSELGDISKDRKLAMLTDLATEITHNPENLYSTEMASQLNMVLKSDKDKEALATLVEEMKRIGQFGDVPEGFLHPHALGLPPGQTPSHTIASIQATPFEPHAPGVVKPRSLGSRRRGQDAMKEAAHLRSFRDEISAALISDPPGPRGVPNPVREQEEAASILADFLASKGVKPQVREPLRIEFQESEVADWIGDLRKRLAKTRKGVDVVARDNPRLWMDIGDWMAEVGEATAQDLKRLQASFDQNLSSRLDPDEAEALFALTDFLTNQHDKISAKSVALTKDMRKKALKHGLGLAGLLMAFGIVKQDEIVNEGT